MTGLAISGNFPDKKIVVNSDEANKGLAPVATAATEFTTDPALHNISADQKTKQPASSQSKGSKTSYFTSVDEPRSNIMITIKSRISENIPPLRHESNSSAQAENSKSQKAFNKQTRSVENSDLQEITNPQKRLSFDKTLCSSMISNSALQNSSSQEKQKNAKAFVCDVCGWKFALKGNLIAHIRRHTGEKPYICETCDQRFTQSSLLTLHLRTHSGEKPFSCQICSRTFSRSGNLNTHMRTHTDSKPYECTFCQKRFSQRVNMELHTRTHTGVKPYRCGVCNRAFTSCSNMKRHWRHIHPNHPEPAPGMAQFQKHSELCRASYGQNLHSAIQETLKNETTGDDRSRESSHAFTTSHNLPQVDATASSATPSSIQFHRRMLPASTVPIHSVINYGHRDQIINSQLSQTYNQRPSFTMQEQIIPSTTPLSEFFTVQRQFQPHSQIPLMTSDIQFQAPVQLIGGLGLTQNQPPRVHSSLQGQHISRRLQLDSGSLVHLVHQS